MFTFLFACTTTAGPLSIPKGDTGVESYTGEDSGLSVAAYSGISEEGAALDYGQQGPLQVESSSGVLELVDCSLEYGRYAPFGDSPLPAVVLSHGFSRSAANMEELALHYAGWGFEVVVPDLCHTGFLDTDPEASALEAIALAGGLELGSVIYAGYSLGGEISTIAAAQDSLAIGGLGLDAVEGSGEPALPYASSLSIPFLGLAGEPSSCNSSNNGEGLFSAMPDARLLRVVEADHCDFEGPTDWMCTSFCTGSNDLFSDQQISTTIKLLSTAGLMVLSDPDSIASQWWTQGEDRFDSLAEEGKVEEISLY
jgi:hypothetical protein